MDRDAWWATVHWAGKSHTQQRGHPNNQIPILPALLGHLGWARFLFPKFFKMRDSSDLEKNCFLTCEIKVAKVCMTET